MLQMSIVLPTYNRLTRLQHVIAALEAQSFPREQFEVIVVSDGSSDGTNDYLQSLKTDLDLRAYFQENRGVAAARNRAISHSKADIIVFIDDDVVPAPQLLSEHWRLHEQGPDRAVLGPMITPEGFAMLPWVRWEQAMLVKQYTAMLRGDWEPTARQFYTGNCSLPRRYLELAGGFDEAFRRAEDVELAYRLADLGLKFIFNPAAIGYHYAERSFESWLGIAYSYGRNDVIFARDKQQRWLWESIREEYERRNRLTKMLVKLCLDRAGLSYAQSALSKLAAGRAERIGLETLASRAYSAIFNLRYYQGVSDEIGGRAALFALLEGNLIPNFEQQTVSQE